jgi:hypothetical protein
MKNFDGFNFGVFVLFCGLAILAGTLTYDAQQQRVLFQQTYNKNLECRQALKDQTVGRVNEICGEVPAIGAFVK